MSGYWRPLDGVDRDGADDPNPYRWPDSPARRLRLGHADEPEVPGYCTCGALCRECESEPRQWSGERAWAGWRLEDGGRDRSRDHGYTAAENREADDAYDALRRATDDR